jgi:hypothetical protein
METEQHKGQSTLDLEASNVGAALRHLTQNTRLSGASSHQNPTRVRREWLPDQWTNRWLARAVVPVRCAGWLALTASAHGDELYGHSNRQEQEAIVGICTRTFRFDCMVKVEFCWTIIASVSLALPCLRKRASLEYRNRERGLVNNTMYAKFQDFGYQLPYNSIK